MPISCIPLLLFFFPLTCCSRLCLFHLGRENKTCATGIINMPMVSLSPRPPTSPSTPTTSLSGAASEEVIWLVRHALITMNIAMLSLLSVSFEARQAAESDAFLRCPASVLAPSKIRCWGGRSKVFFSSCSLSLSIFLSLLCQVHAALNKISGGNLSPVLRFHVVMVVVNLSGLHGNATEFSAGG